MSNDTLKTFATGFSGQVDKAAGIIRGVSVISKGPARGHNVQIDDITLAQVQECCAKFSGGLKVVDRHTKGTDSIFSTTGLLKNFRKEEGKVKADLHLLDSEVNRDKLLEMAEKIPDTFGLSIAFSGPEEKRDGKSYARCVEIYNAALVDTPAANPTGLFSADTVVDASGNGNSTMTPEEILSKCEAKIASALVEFSARLKTAEDALAKQTTELAAANQKVTELSSKAEADKKELTSLIGDENKRIELTAQVVAKEFSKHTGQSAAPRPSEGQGAADPKPAEKFIELTQKHFKETKSQTKALSLAMKEDAEGYKAFRESGKNIKWA